MGVNAIDLEELPGPIDFNLGDVDVSYWSVGSHYALTTSFSFREIQAAVQLLLTAMTQDLSHARYVTPRYMVTNEHPNVAQEASAIHEDPTLIVGSTVSTAA